MPPVVTVVSGSSVSSAIALTRGTGALAVAVGSHAAREWRVGFSIDSGATFQTLRRMDGTATPYTVCSGGTDMLGIVEIIPGRLVRVEVGSLVSTTSVRIIEINRRS